MSEPYLAGGGVITLLALFGTTPPTLTLAVEDGSYDRELGTEEATNTKSGGFYEDAPTVKKWSGSLDCVCEDGAPTNLVEGGLYTLTYTNAKVETVAGKVRIPKIHGQWISPKSKAKYSFDFVSQGSYTVTPGT